MKLHFYTALAAIVALGAVVCNCTVGYAFAPPPNYGGYDNQGYSAAAENTYGGFIPSGNAPQQGYVGGYQGMSTGMNSDPMLSGTSYSSSSSGMLFGDDRGYSRQTPPASMPYEGPISDSFDDSESGSLMTMAEFANPSSYLAHSYSRFSSYDFCGNDFWPSPAKSCEPWSWQLLPQGMIYRAYLAGMKESRLMSLWMNEDRQFGNIWDFALGGRAGILRFGTSSTILPEGYQIDIEGAALGRMDLEHERDMMATDYRFGVPITWGTAHWQYKFAYYHLSSHLGDEYWLQHSYLNRINYVRDELVLGISCILHERIRLYAEAGWAFYTGEDTKPWEFQFGAEYSNQLPDTWLGSPFFAINGHLREEIDFGGSVCVQTGWQWRGKVGNLFRIGMSYYNGMSEQYEFWDRYESKIGGGLWYDF